MRDLDLKAAGAQALCANDIDRMINHMKQGGLSKETLEDGLASFFGSSGNPSNAACEGDVHIGVFFDGTGNNVDEDFGAENNPLPFLKRKHSNVARLYHVFPSEEDDHPQRFTRHSTNKVYRYYVPGVGTKFPEIGEQGESSLAQGVGKGGALRAIWGLAQTLNSAYRFLTGNDTVTDSEIRGMDMDDFSDKLGEKIVEIQQANERFKPKLRAIHLYVFGFSRGATEARAFSNWLWNICDEGRGKKDDATKGTSLHLGGIPIDFKFMGIYDTVASVGLAEIYPGFDGHMSWANKTLEIPAYVKKCVHMVAGHEIRACFPLDSARVNAQYPSNVEEIVCPGAHSDLGGGYFLGALGKDDYTKTPEEDRQIARAYSYDMYLRAIQAGVPFYTIKQCEMLEFGDVKKASLLPTPKMLEDLKAYTIKCNVGAQAVEKQLFYHTSFYLGWRLQQAYDYLLSQGGNPAIAKQVLKELDRAKEVYKDMRAELADLRSYAFWSKKIKGTPAQIAWMDKLVDQQRDLLTYLENCYDKVCDYPKPHGSEECHRLNLIKATRAFQTGKEDQYLGDIGGLDKTQRSLIQVVANYCGNIDRRLTKLKYPNEDFKPFYSWAVDNDVTPPDGQYFLVNDFEELPSLEKALYTTIGTMLGGGAGTMLGGPLGHVLGKAAGSAAGTGYSEIKKHSYDHNFFTNCYFASRTPHYLKMWNQQFFYPKLMRQDAPERDGLWLLEGIAAWQGLDPSAQATLGSFYEKYVHDSEAGFSMMGVGEYEVNGFGLAKFRNVFTGNSGDDYIQNIIREQNQKRIDEVKKLDADARRAAAERVASQYVGVGSMFQMPY